MSTSNPNATVSLGASIDGTDPSSESHFHAMWEDARKDYKMVTGHDFLSSPYFPSDLSKLLCGSSTKDIEAVVNIYSQKFGDFRTRGSKLRAFLSPVVKLVGLFLDTGAEVASATRVPGGKAILVAFGVLLGAAGEVSKKYDVLVELLSKLVPFLTRVEVYASSASVVEDTLKKIIVRILTHLLHVLALFTKYFRNRPLSGLLSRAGDYSKHLFGDKGVNGALTKLDQLTREEELAVAATTYAAVQGVAGNVTALQKDVRSAVTKYDATLELLKIREWLSPPTGRDEPRSFHPKDTCQWILDEKFESWKRTKNGVYWIKGKPGCGKSVLCSFVINTLSRDPSLNVVCFYFDFRDPQKQTVRGFLASLVYQLASRSEYYRDISTSFHEKNQARGPPSNEMLVDCLMDMLRISSTLYIITDGLDEYPESEREGALFPVLRQLTELSNDGLRLLFTSRPEPDIQELLRDVITHSTDILESQAHGESIARYVSQSLSKHPFRSWPSDVKQLAEQILKSKADGMFLWVKLQLEALRHCALNDIAASLEDLPSTLPDTYGRILSKSTLTPTTAMRIRRIFECIAFATRPLEPTELAQVLTVEFDLLNGNVALGDPHHTHDLESLLVQTCLGFIHIVEKPLHKRRRGIYSTSDSRVVEFIHASALDFLVSDDLPESIRIFHLIPDAAHTTLARMSLATLLSLSPPSALPFRNYATQSWHKHIFPGTVSEAAGVLLGRFLDPTGIYPHFDKWQEEERPRGRNGAHSVLYWAAYTGLVDHTRRSLSSDRIDINAIAGPEGTALCAASSQGYHDAVLLLLNYGANINAKGTLGRTPLHLAASRGHLSTTEILTRKGAAINARDFSNLTPLGQAVENGHVSVVQALIKAGASTNAGLWGGSALHDAKTSHVVQALIDGGADINARNWNQETPLHNAIEYNHVEAAMSLLWHGADADARDKNQMTPLHHAAIEGHAGIVQALVDKGAAVNTYNSQQETPLYSAVYQNHEEIAMILLRNGAEVDARDRLQQTPLHHAARGGCTGIIQALIDGGADVNACDTDRRTPLNIAVTSKSEYAVSMLLQSGAKLGRLEDEDELIEAVMKSGPDSVELVIAELLPMYTADPNAPNSDGRTLLHLAAHYDSIPVARVLISARATVDARDKDGETPLLVAARRGHVRLVQLLAEHGANINIHSEPRHSGDDGMVPLHIAAQQNDTNMVDLLVQELKADPDTRTTYGRTALIYAAMGDYEAIARLLLAAGADINAKDNYGRSALEHAAAWDHEAIARLLLAAGADINAKNEDGESALMSAAEVGHETVVRLLLAAGADINAKDKGGQNALMYAAAAEDGSETVVRPLLAAGADINAKDKDGQSALIYAAKSGNETAVHLLLAAGADINAMDKDSRGALMYAAKWGCEAMVHSLLAAGADINAMDKDSRSALMYAAKWGCEAMVRSLLAAGVDVNAKDKDGRSALIYAAIGYCGAIVRPLLAAGADINAKDKDSRSALIYAAKAGHETEARLLLAAGADINAMDKDGRSALDLAEEGLSMSWAYLKEKRARVVQLLRDAGGARGAGEEIDLN